MARLGRAQLASSWRASCRCDDEAVGPQITLGHYQLLLPHLVPGDYHCRSRLLMTLDHAAAPTLARDRPTGRRKPAVLAELAAGRGLEGLAIVRLLLAGAVILSHSWALGGFGPEPTLPGTNVTVGLMAVAGFLALSGFLVTLSLIRMRVGRFLWHRTLRIMPAYWVALLMMASVLGPAAWWISGRSGPYLSADPSPVGFVTSNWWLGQEQSGIGGIFASNPFGSKLGSPFDGSLWSLAYEFLCYLIVAAIALAAVTRRLRRFALPTTVAVLTLGCALVATHYQLAGISIKRAGYFDLPLLGPLSWRVMVPLGLAFGCGSLLAFGATKIRLSRLVVAGAALAAVLGVAFPKLHYLLLYPSLPILLLGMGTLFRGHVSRWFRHNDASYGTYLYGFPCQQSLAATGLGAALGPFGFAAAAMLMAFLLGLLSWRSIERPALRLKGLPPPWRWTRSSTRPGRELAE